MTKEEAKKEIIDMANTLQLIPNTPKGKAVSMALKALEQKSKWIPVSNPQKELPKDRVLWVTIDDDRYAQDKGGYYWQGGLAVTTIYWDMTEWSDDIVDYVLAYMDYVEPIPYRA